MTTKIEMSAFGVDDKTMDLRMRALQEWKILQLHALPDAKAGRLQLFFALVNTKLSSAAEDVFGVGAVLMQAGRPLASLRMLSTYGFDTAPEDWKFRLRKDDRDDLTQLPRVRDNQVLRENFGDFVLWCWGVAAVLFGSKKTVADDLDLIGGDLMAVIHEGGIYGRVEDRFYDAAMATLDPADYSTWLDKLGAVASAPYARHTARGLARDMRYSPYVFLALPKLGLKRRLNPDTVALNLAMVCWALENRNVRLKEWKLPR